MAKNSGLKPPEGQPCPLSVHQARTWEAMVKGDADVIFNTAATGDGKSLAAYLAGLLDKNFRIMGLYPTIELVDDQDRSHRDSDDRQGWHSLFGLNADKRIDRLYGEELSRRVRDGESNRFQELRKAIENKPLILTNPDIFHLITHFQYRNPAYGDTELPLLMAEFPDVWVFDEFHIFGPHQESAVINSLSFIRRSQQRKRRFLFTSATPKESFIKQLRASGFKTEEISGNYADHAQPGYRRILEAVDLEFVQLKKQDAKDWLADHHADIAAALTTEDRGRGLIILNSVAQAGRVVKRLRDLFQDSIEVEEISGRMDRVSRQQTQDKLKHSAKPVLIVGTSAVDVGVDFRIHLLIFESSNSATVIQRLGRLGRHEGFKHYQAIALLPEHTPWILSRLKQTLSEDVGIDREVLRDAVLEAFDAPKEFQEYQREWGVVQAHGMLAKLQVKEYAKVMQPVYDRITQDLQPLYGNNISGTAKWKLRDFEKPDLVEAIQSELIRFRGGASLQTAVWDENRFYTYDLLRILPYTQVEVLEEADFLDAARNRGYPEYAFQSAQVFLKVQRWVDERIDIQLRSGRDSSELQGCTLILLDKLHLTHHPQADVINCLSRKKFLSFLVPGDYWKVRDALRVGPLFGLHPLTDSSEKTYACAFSQDALLLKALKNSRLTKLCRQNSASLFF